MQQASKPMELQIFICCNFLGITQVLAEEVIKEARYLEYSTKLLQGLVNSDE